MLQYSTLNYTETLRWDLHEAKTTDSAEPALIFAFGDIDAAEREFLNQPQVQCPVIHRFGPGVYIREVMIPAGSLAIGHHQNFEHMNVMLKGRVTILNDDGTTSELVAPMIFAGKPGRKVGYIHEDMVWLNIYPTTETDVAKLEAHYLTKSSAWIESNAARESLLLLSSNVDAIDYQEALKELGVTEEIVAAQSKNTEDMTDLPFGGYKIKIGDSKIHGKGLFATADIIPGEIIAPARIRGKRTIAGRYTNHSAKPNAKMVRGLNSEIDLVAIANILGCKGGQDGDEITIDYRESARLAATIGRLD